MNSITSGSSPSARAIRIFSGDIADAFGNNYRFTEAVAYARAAIEEDPEYWQGYTLLGGNLI